MFGTRILDGLAARLRTEYTDLPGLRLTAWQAQRLYSTTPEEAKDTLERLVRSGFLRVAGDGTYVRR